MGEFFHGWRRKCGLLFLILALVVMIGWVRSDRYDDIFTFAGANSLHRLRSFQAGLAWIAEEYPIEKVPAFKNILLHWESRPILDQSVNTNAGVCTWRWKAYGFDFGESSHFSSGQTIRDTFWVIPYWTIILPLTLLSTRLLLTKPRKSTPKKIAESIPEKVA